MTSVGNFPPGNALADDIPADRGDLLRPLPPALHRADGLLQGVRRGQPVDHPAAVQRPRIYPASIQNVPMPVFFCPSDVAGNNPKNVGVNLFACNYYGMFSGLNDGRRLGRRRASPPPTQRALFRMGLTHADRRHLRRDQQFARRGRIPDRAWTTTTSAARSSPTAPAASSSTPPRRPTARAGHPPRLPGLLPQRRRRPRRHQQPQPAGARTSPASRRRQRLRRQQHRHVAQPAHRRRQRRLLRRPRAVHHQLDPVGHLAGLAWISDGNTIGSY